MSLKFFFRARLNESFADILVVRKNCGVLIIKVADSELSIAPLTQVKLQKKSFCTVSHLRSNDLPVQTAIFFPYVTEEQVKKFFGFPKETNMPLLFNYVLLLTRESLERDGLKNLPKMNFLIAGRVSEFFSEEIYDEICRAVKPFGEVNSADELSYEQRKRLEPLLSGGSPNVKFFPELTDLPYMRPFPTDGELYLLKFLRDYLGKMNGEFEVFFQAHWGGGFPDVVVMRKNHGILIIEVKDWNLDLHTFDDKFTWTLKSNNARLKSPVAQVRFYKDLFYNTYSRTLAEKNLHEKAVYSLVQTAVFFYNATEEQVARIPTDGYVKLLTREELEHNGLNKISYAGIFFGDKTASFFSDEIYNELCRELKPSDHSLSKIFFLTKLDKKQQELALSQRNYKRQLKGPAGSGKTTVLAFRAVDAFRKTNAPVLILTFNITLCHYIHDCISHALNSVSGIEGRKGYIMRKFFNISHFHEFIKSYRNHHDQIDRATTDKDGKTVDTYTLEATPTRYQTIYVDETQDFESGWMKTILSLLEPGGELIFFGDKDQDLYLRRQIDHVPGVIGRPLSLKGTYRLQTRILDLARAFQINFFGGSVGNEIEPSVEQNLFEATTVRYYFHNQFDVSEIVKIFESLIKEYQITNDDVCILSQVIKNVRPIDKVLRDSGYKTTTTFECEEDYSFCRFDKQKRDDIRRVAKHNFWMESGKIKLATIQSYKGWGIHSLILIIGNDSAMTDKEKFLNAEMVYTGLTRAKKNLVVINIGDKEYHEFFSAAVKNLRT